MSEAGQIQQKEYTKHCKRKISSQEKKLEDIQTKTIH